MLNIFGGLQPSMYNLNVNISFNAVIIKPPDQFFPPWNLRPINPWLCPHPGDPTSLHLIRRQETTSRHLLHGPERYESSAL